MNELLDAELFSSLIRLDLENIDAHASILSNVTREIHATNADQPVFPDINANIKTTIQQMDVILSSDEIAFL